MLFFFRVVPWNGLAVLQGNQEPLVVKKGWKNLRWLWGEQVCRMRHIFPSVLWHCWLGDRKSIQPVKSWLLVCWWWPFDWSFAHLVAPVLTISSVILSSSSEFNVVDCLAQVLGLAYRGGTLLAHGSNFGTMPFLPALVTQWVPLGVEPRLTGHKSVALTTEPRLLRYP